MMLYAAQMIMQVMLRCSPHLEAGIFEQAELQPSLDRQEEQRGRTLCGGNPACHFVAAVRAAAAVACWLPCSTCLEYK